MPRWGEISELSELFGQLLTSRVMRCSSCVSWTPERQSCEVLLHQRLMGRVLGWPWEQLVFEKMEFFFFLHIFMIKKNVKKGKVLWSKNYDQNLLMKKMSSKTICQNPLKLEQNLAKWCRATWPGANWPPHWDHGKNPKTHVNGHIRPQKL
jgi:hypothetical protein